MSTFYWVRHAPTHQKSFVGWRDVPADLNDHNALSRLNAYLPENALIVSSDLQRCVQTADAITGNRTRLPHMAGLRELHFGVWDGMHFSEVAERWPDLSRAYWEEPGDHTPPGGESWNQSAQRVSCAADHLRRIADGRDVIVVAHFGAILTQVQRAMDCTPYQVLGHKIDNLSVTEISFQSGKAETKRINHSA